jgi:hypothetical protein
MKQGTQTELVVAEKLPSPTAPMISGVNIEAILNKAIDSKAAVEVVKELLAMWREDQADRAKAMFDEALSAFQSECPVVQKEKVVKTNTGQKAYSYAPIEAIEIQIRPILRKFGFSHSFDTDTASQAGWVIAKCIVTHSAGHSRTSTGKFPLGSKTNIMSDTQVYAAALTFANRRALCNAYGLVLAGEDLDGQTGKLKPVGPSSKQPDRADLKPLAQELWDVLKTVRGAEENWNAANQFLWREEILDAAANEAAPDLSADKFREVIKKSRELLAR